MSAIFDGASVVDVTDPEAPFEVGFVRGAARSGGRSLSFGLDDLLHPKLLATSTSGYSQDATSMPVTHGRTAVCGDGDQ